MQNNWGTICTLLGMPTKDGKMRKIQMSDTEGILRIIQSIPSPKAEPFKRWLARVGSERIEEINNPELALTNLGEATAVEFHKKNNSQGLEELKKDMNKAGKVLNKAKQEIENELERPVVTSENYIELTQKEELLDIK